MKKPIVVIGSINMDLVCRTPHMPVGGETILGSEFVTIPGGKAIPGIGQLIETKYLYAYKGGSLYQPQFLRVRDDISTADTLADLKYKSDGLDSEEE